MRKPHLGTVDGAIANTLYKRQQRREIGVRNQGIQPELHSY
jgi:hypothetical protein